MKIAGFIAGGALLLSTALPALAVWPSLDLSGQLVLGKSVNKLSSNTGGNTQLVTTGSVGAGGMMETLTASQSLMETGNASASLTSVNTINATQETHEGCMWWCDENHQIDANLQVVAGKSVNELNTNTGLNVQTVGTQSMGGFMPVFGTVKTTSLGEMHTGNASANANVTNTINATNVSKLSL